MLSCQPVCAAALSCLPTCREDIWEVFMPYLIQVHGQHIRQGLAAHACTRTCTHKHKHMGGVRASSSARAWQHMHIHIHGRGHDYILPGAGATANLTGTREIG